MSSHINVTVQGESGISVQQPVRTAANVTVSASDIEQPQAVLDGVVDVNEVNTTGPSATNAGVRTSLPNVLLKIGDIEIPLNRVFASEAPPLNPHEGDVWIDIRERD